MNMKGSEKSPAVKRVFISIREKPPNNIPRKPLQPKPPCQPAKFIRKRQDSSRCHTPDQSGGKPTPPVTVSKPTFRRSLSPFFQPVLKETICTPYFKPKDIESLMPTPQIDKEDSLCMPYELHEVEKPVKPRNSRGQIRAIGRNIDLTKGIFSKKQNVGEMSFAARKESENSRLSVSSTLQGYDESTTIATRTPSPIVPPRNNRCHALSKNFKINKQYLVNEAEKQNRSKSTEKETYEIEAPWQSILRDLDNAMQIKDLSPHQPSRDMPRIPVKLTRVYNDKVICNYD